MSTHTRADHRVIDSLRRLLVGCLSALWLAAAAQAGQPSVALPDRQRSYVLDTLRTRIGFEAGATMGAFGGTARRFRGHAEIADTASLTGATGRIEIDVASFRTGIGIRDGHLRGDLDADEYPTITFVLASARRSAEPFSAETGLVMAADEPARAPVLLSGQLTIRGETRDIGIPALVRFAADSLYARGRVPVRFTDFDMKRPSRLLGMAKVDDALVLHFDAVFTMVR